MDDATDAISPDPTGDSEGPLAPRWARKRAAAAKAGEAARSDPARGHRDLSRDLWHLERRRFVRGWGRVL